MSNDPNHKCDVAIVIRRPDAPIVRSSVPPSDDYLSYREHLRLDCWYSCAYCNISELEASGIRFTIDHYLPQKRYPELESDYTNLLWCCDQCNTSKGIKPSEAASRKGHRFYRPDFDDPRDHFRISASNPQLLEWIDKEVGEYTHTALRLNRSTLRKVRDLRRRIANSSAVLQNGMRSVQTMSLDSLPREVRAQFETIKRRLEQRGEAIQEVLCDRVLREANRSELLDADPAAEAESRERKAYLKRIDSMPAVLASTRTPASNPAGRVPRKPRKARGKNKKR